MRLTYLIGEPGVGKSTLLAAATEGLEGYAVKRPFARIVWNDQAVELGVRRAGGFSGTDGLSMSVQPKVIEWLMLPDYQDVFGEGDRLATGTFFAAVQNLGFALTVVVLTADEATVEQRRTSRAAVLQGAKQDPTWVRGRITKVRRLAEEWGTHAIDTRDTIEEQVAALRKLPVFDTLGGNHDRNQD